MIMTDFITNPQERTRFIKFAIVGSIGALVDFVVFNILTKFLHVDPVLSSVLSFSVAVSAIVSIYINARAANLRPCLAFLLP